MQRLIRLIPVLVCGLALFLVYVTSAQDAAEAPQADAPADAAGQADQADAAPQAEDAPQANAPVEELRVPEASPLTQRFHGIRLDQTGKLNAMTTTIDPNTLQLVPEPDVDVFFVQQGRVIAQGRSDAGGQLSLTGLTGNSVYSVIARSANRSSSGALTNQTADSWYSAFSVAVFPSEDQVAGANRGTHFASLLRQADPPQVGNVMTLTVITAQDLAAVGLPAFPDQFPPGGLTPGQTGAGGGSGGGGTGSGGGGGGAAAAGAAGAAAAAAGAAAGSQSAASPFTP